MALLESTKELLARARKTMNVAEIAEASDGTVERDWLYRFARGKIPNPGVKPVQALYDCLKKISRSN